MSLSYVTELPTAGSKNHRFKVKDLGRFESMIQILTSGRQYRDPTNSLNSIPSSLQKKMDFHQKIKFERGCVGGRLFFFFLKKTFIQNLHTRYLWITFYLLMGITLRFLNIIVHWIFDRFHNNLKCLTYFLHYLSQLFPFFILAIGINQNDLVNTFGQRKIFLF